MIKVQNWVLKGELSFYGYKATHEISIGENDVCCSLEGEELCMKTEKEKYIRISCLN